jgi:hypothetical protein
MRQGLGWDGKETKLGRVKSRQKVDERSRMSEVGEKKLRTTRKNKRRAIEFPYLDRR